MKIFLAISGVFALSAFSASSVIDLATGLDGSGNVLASGGLQDANWIVSNANNYDDPNKAFTVFPGNNDWYGGWLANGPKSDWIAAAFDNSNNGSFTASRVFKLTAQEAANATFSNAAWSLDDAGSIVLNGVVQDSLGAGNWGGLHSVSLNAGLLHAGNNILEIRITDSDNFLEAVRFEGTLNTNPTPEPATMAILGLGIAAVARRRKATK